MFLVRMTRSLSIAVAAGVLMISAAPPASADEIRDDQWALRAFGSESVWKESTGKGVTVALIDHGVKGEHPDLEKNVLRGKNLATGGRADTESENDHGTVMASLIAGHGHGPGGSAGVKGLAPDAKILPIDQYEHAETEQAAQDSLHRALHYAVDSGAKVVNMSFQTGRLGSREKEAIAYALRSDVVLVSSAGNDGIDKLDNLAAHPGIIGVGAIDQGLKLWDGSHSGSGLTLTAPGTNMRSAAVERSYKLTEGTSNSAAYVSAAVALVRSKYPDLTAGQAVNRLVKTALMPDHVKERKTPDKEYGYGIVRPYSALTKDIPPGPEEGPLEIPKAPSPSPSVAPTFAQPNQASESGSSTPMVLGILGGVGVVGAIVAAVLVVVSRRRRGAHEPPRPHAQQGYGYPQPPPSHPPGTYQNPPPPGFGPPKQ